MLTNTTVEEASWVVSVEAGGGQVGFLCTTKHKTALTYGGAEVVLQEEVLRWFLTYRDIVRPKIGYTEGSGFLFATITGTKGPSAQILLLTWRKLPQGLDCQQLQPNSKQESHRNISGWASRDDNEGRHVATPLCNILSRQPMSRSLST